MLLHIRFCQQIENLISRLPAFVRCSAHPIPVSFRERRSRSIYSFGSVFVAYQDLVGLYAHYRSELRVQFGEMDVGLPFAEMPDKP